MTTPDAPPPESGPLSVDQAVDLIAGPEARAEAQAEDEAEDAGVEPHEADRAEDVDDPPGDPDTFERLPPDVKAALADRERVRDEEAGRAIQAAEEARHIAHAHVARATELTERLSAIVPQVEAAFAERWGGGEPDWAQVAAAHGPQAATELKAAFDQEQAQLQAMEGARAEAEARSFNAYVEIEYEKLKTIQPELAEGHAGLQRRNAVVQFLAASGVPADQIRHVGALELSMAYDALRYRLASASMARPQRGESRVSARPSLSPAAALAPRSSQAKRTEAAKSRFARKPTVDNAVAAILAKGS